MAKTAAELMAQAKALVEQAKKIEEANALKIGKYVMTNLNRLKIEELRAYVKSVTNGSNGAEASEKTEAGKVAKITKED